MHKYSIDKVKGTLYGLAIGDAMGTTTEYFTQTSIKKMYKKRADIIGKGWLNLYPGEVTDPTESAFCVCDALQTTAAFRNKNKYKDKLLNQCCRNFEAWLDSYPVDMENCCKRAIINCRDLGYEEWIRFSENPATTENSNLFRCIPVILTRHKLDYVLDQSRLTHNNRTCDEAVIRLRDLLLACLKNEDLTTEVFSQLPPRYRHIDYTLDNALYHLETTITFEGAVMEAVYHGGDTDAIAALTGSLAGAMLGYDSIPARWIAQLRPEVKEKLDRYSAFISGTDQPCVS